MRAAFREPQRPWLFALAVLIHAGLFQLLVSQRQAAPQSPERRAMLVLLPDAAKPRLAPPPVAPVTPQRLPELSLPASTPPLLVAPSRPDGTAMPPVIDWQREAEEASLKQALAAEAQRDQKGGGPSKAKPEFGWDRSRVHRVEACAPMSMPEAATLPLTEWESFYVIIGGSAAALTGLMSLQRIQREQEKPGK